MYYNFTFVGAVKGEVKSEIKALGSKGARKETISFMLAGGDNKQYVQFELWKNKTQKDLSTGKEVEILPTQVPIMQMKADGKSESVKVDFVNRKAEHLIKNAPNFVKKDCFGETFITYDQDFADKLLAKNEDKTYTYLKEGTRLYVKGTVTYYKSKKNGKVYPNYMIESIRLAKEDEKDLFQVLAEVYFTKDAIDPVQFDGTNLTDQAFVDGIVPIQVWVAQKNDFNDKTKVNYVDLTLTLNLTKIKDRTAVANLIERLDIMLEDFQAEEGQVKCIQVKYEPFKGAETVELSEEELVKTMPDRVKKYYEKNMMTLDEAKYSMGITKEKVDEFRFKAFGISPKYANGAELMAFTLDDVLATQVEEVAQETVVQASAVDLLITQTQELEDLL